MRLLFAGGSRLVFRLSGTGSVGATLRMCVERYVPPAAGRAALGMETAEALAPLVAFGREVSGVGELTGRAEASVVT
mgnify:CR=1 FL=1